MTDKIISRGAFHHTAPYHNSIYIYLRCQTTYYKPTFKEGHNWPSK